MNDDKIREFKAVLFDLDGTLVDDGQLHADSMNDALREHGEQYVIAPEEEHRYIGHTTKAVLNMLVEDKKLPWELIPWIAGRKQVITLRRFEQHIKRDDTKVALMQSLRQRGVKIAICTNAVKKSTNTLLRLIGVRDLVDVVITSEDVTNPKPDPEMFLMAARRFGVDIADCVVVENTGVGEAAAKAAGAGLVVIVDSAKDVSEIMF